MGFPKQGPVIAIDGPAGTGKSSAAKRLSDLLGFTHVDTGSLYRSISLCCLEKGILFSGTQLSEEDRKKAIEIAKSTHLEFKRDKRKNPANRITANGSDVTPRIRTPEVSMAASIVSAIPEVRAALLGLQRTLGCVGKTILEGRDIGTVIFPDADVKFFLTASLEERAKRRLAELEASGSDTASFEEIKTQIKERDEGDSTRAVSPLRMAEDAIRIETTNLTLDEVVQEMASGARRLLT